MWTKVKRVFAVAAGLVVGGTTIMIGLEQANQIETNPYTCDQWAKVVQAVNALPQESFFVAVESGFSAPAAVGDKLIGDCSGGVCSISKCNDSIKYEYKSSSLVAGWRLFQVQAPRYFAGAWKELATAKTEVRFYRGFKEIVADCLLNFTAGDCKNLVSAINNCWKRIDGQYCIDGKLYGPGKGGFDSCIIGATDVPFPCSSNRGHNWADREISKTFPSDLDLALPGE